MNIMPLPVVQAVRGHRGKLRLPRSALQLRWGTRFLRVAYDTGCRSSEIFHLELAQFDLERGLLRVKFKQRFAIKERREKVIPLTRRLRRFIAALRKRYPHERNLLDDGHGRLAYSSPGAFAPQLQRDRTALGFNGRCASCCRPPGTTSTSAGSRAAGPLKRCEEKSAADAHRWAQMRNN
jgi:integrase